MLGIFIFLTPIRFDGKLTIGIGVITDWVKALLGDYGLHVLVSIIVVTAVLTVLATVFKLRLICSRSFLKGLFDVPVIWLMLRLVGAVFSLLYFFQVGPELLRSESVGGAVFVDIGVNVICIYISACLLMPLLTEFGFMEFVGTLAGPIFRMFFRLPGRAAIDATASFVGASSIGLLITIGQYERGYYTAREASVIAANFSVVSIPFSLVVASVAGIDRYFIQWYGVVVLTCLICAFITPRLPPLSRKPETLFPGVPERVSRGNLEPQALFSEAWLSAKERAKIAPGIKEYFASALRNLAFFLFVIVAATMAIATMATLLTLHTPIFSWLASPLVPFLDYAQLADASTASPGLLAGFLDQYMPAIVASGIASDTTSFVLAGLSVCQLIYMSEVGVLILRSSLPLSFFDLVAIFLLRTVISLPLLILGAHWVV